MLLAQCIKLFRGHLVTRVMEGLHDIRDIDCEKDVDLVNVSGDLSLELV